MAEKEKEKKTNKEEKAENEKKKSPLMLIIIIIVAGLIVGGGGTVAFFMFKNKGDNVNPDKEVTEEKKVIKPDILGPMYMLEPFIVNLSGAEGRNYLKVEMGFELNNQAVIEEINNKIPQIKDAVVLLLSSKSYEDVKTLDGKVALKEALLIRLNNFLKSGSINSIYFTNFVVQ